MNFRNLLIFIVMLLAFCSVGYAQVPYNQGGNQYDPYSNNSPNYSTRTPFKLEVARLDASVYRAGETPLPLSQVPRLNKGDTIRVKLAQEPINGVMPHASNWDWTILVAFINPSRNSSDDEIVSQEVRLMQTGWYSDYFFQVPFDSQPMIFVYPKSNYRNRILDLIKKHPNEIWEMGEKILEISSAYGHISSFLSQAQYMMSRPEFYSSGQIEQSIEGMARVFNLSLPNCWSGYGGYGGYGGGYGAGNGFALRAQCLSQNIRVDDLNYSVGRMLEQGGLAVLAQIKQRYPEIAQWVALAAVAIDFIMKLTNKSTIRIIPTIASTPDNPLVQQNGFMGAGGYNTPGNTFSATSPRYSSSFEENSGSTKISLLANYQPSAVGALTIYAYIPNQWEPVSDPRLTRLKAPQLVESCVHEGANLLRNMDVRIEWLSDNFTREFALMMDDGNGWKREIPLRKNLGLNAWELDLTRETLGDLPVNNKVKAKIVGRRGFTLIESESFEIHLRNQITYEVSSSSLDDGKSTISLKRVAGDSICTEAVYYTFPNSQRVEVPISVENGRIKFNNDRSEISFIVDRPSAEGIDVKVKQSGGTIVSVKGN